MRTFVIGDIHGAYKALIQCFERSGFDKNKDTLIVLGDVCDGWSQVRECVDELLSIHNLIYIMGNHDEWFRYWYMFGKKEYLWISQGGTATLNSYNYDDVPESHKEMFNKAPFYYIHDNKVFVHGGLKLGCSIEKTSNDYLTWDRSTWRFAGLLEMRGPDKKLDTPYDEIFIGHTAVRDGEKIKKCNVYNLDTGAGWSGVLTIMDIDTHQYWQSDNVLKLYSGEVNKRL